MSDFQSRDPIKSKFYNSSKWRKTAKAFAESKCYICENCKNKYLNPEIKPIYKQLHVHHKIEITRENVDNPDIALNFDNLMLLCQHCHNIITTKNSPIAIGLAFDENGMLRKI